MSIFNVWDVYTWLLKDKTSQLYYSSQVFHFANQAVIAIMADLAVSF